MLNVRPQARPASPAFGSPVRLQAGRAEFQEEIAALNGEIEVVEDDDDDDEGGVYLDKKSAKRRSRAKVETPMPASKERKRRREEEEDGVVAVEAVTAKLKGRAALQPIDNTSKSRFKLCIPVDRSSSFFSSRPLRRPRLERQEISRRSYAVSVAQPRALRELGNGVTARRRETTTLAVQRELCRTEAQHEDAETRRRPRVAQETHVYSTIRREA